MKKSTVSNILNAIGCVTAETTLAAFSYSQLATIAPNVLRTEVQGAYVASIFMTSLVTNAAAIISPTQDDFSTQHIPRSKLGSFILAIGIINTAFVFYSFSSGIFYAFLKSFGSTLLTKTFGLILGATASYCFSRGYYNYVVQNSKIYCDQFFAREADYFSLFSKKQFALLIAGMLCLAVTAFAEACFSDFIFNATSRLFCEAFSHQQDTHCKIGYLQFLGIIPALSGGLIALCGYPWVILNRIHPAQSNQPLLPTPSGLESHSSSNWRFLAWFPILCSSLADGLRNAFSVLAILMISQLKGNDNLSLLVPTAVAGLMTYSIFNKPGVNHLYETGRKLLESCHSSFARMAV